MAVAPAGGSAQTEDSVTMAKIARKDAITVLVTDSGLGPSVAADIERRARTSGAYRSIHIIFANALPEASRGYNRMPTVERKVQVFDDALAGMVRWYKPDAILVACNTLSVLIPRTRGAQGTPLLAIRGDGCGYAGGEAESRPGQRGDHLRDGNDRGGRDAPLHAH